MWLVITHWLLCIDQSNHLTSKFSGTRNYNFRYFGFVEKMLRFCPVCMVKWVRFDRRHSIRNNWKFIPDFSMIFFWTILSKIADSIIFFSEKKKKNNIRIGASLLIWVSNINLKFDTIAVVIQFSLFTNRRIIGVRFQSKNFDCNWTPI